LDQAPRICQPPLLLPTQTQLARQGTTTLLKTDNAPAGASRRLHDAILGARYLDGEIMPNKNVRVYHRRLTGPRKPRVQIPLRVPLFFVILAIFTAVVGIWLNERFNEAPFMHRLFHARSNLGHKP
jgi:hypothetical protein